ncbi:hypothetical protein TL18_00425 [Methanobrevibacter sp. YE315]|uniref:right-handed parallel beta-helix repeat-containing protein n=1 Tax=Methanobrevibacter sp. YE315 TaxID=1609968 RepID=UPI000764DB42|nr:right-handed parallel beta-helix repeat-containing protein [Methanobrevibacter sp. YE315]AMD16636.1 hypothetical protein TL18_00425 [Methanobrevibacter sp. YE315]
MKFKVIFALLLLLITISAVCAEENQTLESGKFDDLQKKVDDAKKYSEIVLDDDYTQGSAPIKINKDISIDGKGHIIDGQGKHSLITCSQGTVTLKNIMFKNGYSEEDGGAIYISGKGVVEIINCTFIGNKAYRGGAIANWGDTVFITNSTFKQNTALLDFGGAVLSCSNSVIDNCYFESNRAEKAGGAVFTSYTPLGISTITNSIFIKNTADEDGGAISNSGDLRFEECEFMQNYATYGGAIWSNRWLTFSDKESIFTENGAYYGGAIYAYTFDSVAFNLIFNKNYAYAYGGAVMLYSRDASTVSKYYFKNCTFNGNKCEKKSVFYDGRGGAIYFDTYTTKPCELKIDGCSFSDNYAYDDGGAIYVDKGRDNNNILEFVGSPSYFNSNVAESTGGAIYSYCDIRFNSSSVNFVKNQAKDGNGGAVYTKNNIMFNLPSTFEENYAKTDGGAIYCDKEIYFNNVPLKFIYNQAEVNGGAVYTNYISNVKNAIFIDNHAEKDGGAIYVNKESHFDVTSCLFDSNMCVDEGGAIYLDSSSSSISLSYNIFFTNRADMGGTVYNCGKYSNIYQNWWGHDTPNFGNGDLIEWYVTKTEKHYDSDPLKMRITLGSTTTGVNKSVPVEYSLVSTYGNEVNGEISMLGYYYYLVHTNSGEFSQAVLNKNSMLSSYTPRDVGIHHISVKGWSNPGAFLTVDESSEPDNVVQVVQSNYRTFTDLQTIIDNAPSNSVINLDKDYAYFIHDFEKEQKGITINKNIVIDGHGHTIDAQYASRIFYSSEGTVTLKNLILTDGYEYDDDDGGAIFIKSDAKYVIVNCTFSYNHAWQDGGAIFNDGGELRIQNSTFSNNLAQGASILNDCDGGAIHSKAHLIIDNCVFDRNTAADSGGAIYATNGLTIENTPSSFMYNKALHAKGGAIRTNKFMKDVKYASFIGNEANKNDGGAIYINDENHITFTQCLFAYNHCGDRGGAMYLDSISSHLTLSNNIFLFNDADKQGQTVFNSGYFDKINNNWWGNNNPSKSNDQLIEWKFLPWESNEPHTDSDPLKINLVLNREYFIINETVTATLCFYKSDGSLFTGEIFDAKFDNNYISFTVNPSLTNEVKYNTKNAIMELTAEKIGTFDVICEVSFHSGLESISVSKTFNVLNLTIVAPEIKDYYSNSQTLKVYLEGDKDIIANQRVGIHALNNNYEMYTDENGVGSFCFSNYVYPGVYSVSLDVLGISAKTTYTVLSTINATDIVRVLGNHTPFYAEFVDGNGEFLPEYTVVGVAIDDSSVTYVNVKSNGLASFNIAFLGVGQHYITLFNFETSEAECYQITILPEFNEGDSINNGSHQHSNSISQDSYEDISATLPFAGYNNLNNQSDDRVGKSILKNQSNIFHDNNNAYLIILLIILICLFGALIKRYKDK